MEAKTFFKLFIIIFALLLAQATVFAQEDCPEEERTFRHGEELTYMVYYNWKFVWIPAGEARFTLVEHDDHYLAEAVGKTFESYDNLFRVRDRFVSRFDKKTLRPMEFLRTIEEGKYRKFDSMVFDRKLDVVRKFQGKHKDQASWSAENVDPCIFDIMSLLYYLRSKDIQSYDKGDKVQVEMYLDDKTYPIDLTFGKRYDKKIKKLGKYSVVEVIPELISGNVFNEGDKMKIIVSDDKNKIPLMIESPVKIGSVKVVLKDYKNIKYPLKPVEG